MKSANILGDIRLPDEDVWTFASKIKQSSQKNKDSIMNTQVPEFTQSLNHTLDGSEGQMQIE